MYSKAVRLEEDSGCRVESESQQEKGDRHCCRPRCLQVAIKTAQKVDRSEAPDSRGQARLVAGLDLDSWLLEAVLGGLTLHSPYQWFGGRRTANRKLR